MSDLFDLYNFYDGPPPREPISGESPAYAELRLRRCIHTARLGRTSAEDAIKYLRAALHGPAPAGYK
jgi:hypothetical protein